MGAGIVSMAAHSNPKTVSIGGRGREQNNHPKDVHVLITRAHGCVTLPGKRDIVGLIKLRMLRWEITFNYLGKPNVTTRILSRKREAGGSKTWGQEWRLGVGWGWGQEPRGVGASSSWKRQESRYSTRVSGRDQPCPHLDFSPFLTSRTVG